MNNENKNKNSNRFENFYFKDGKKYKVSSKKRPNAIRIPIFESSYRWWKLKSYDFRVAIVPIGLCFIATFSIYKISVIIYEKEERVKN